MNNGYRFSGCIPANLLPFTADLQIDVAAYKKHLRWLADTKGVTAIVANGHAAEVSSLSREERKRALALALEEVGGKVPIIAGVYSDGTHEAIELARDAKAAGASGLLIFPPTIFMWGAQVKPDMALRHFSMLADGVDLPLIVFEYPPASGIGLLARDALRALQDPDCRGRQGLVQRHRRLREEPARAPGLRAPRRDAVIVHDVVDGELPAWAPTAASRAWAASRPTSRPSSSPP